MAGLWEIVSWRYVANFIFKYYQSFDTFDPSQTTYSLSVNSDIFDSRGNIVFFFPKTKPLFIFLLGITVFAFNVKICLKHFLERCTKIKMGGLCQGVPKLKGPKLNGSKI